MRLWTGDEVLGAEIVARPVLVLEDETIRLPGDVVSWYVLDASDVEVEALRVAGYLLPLAVTLCRDLGLEAGMRARQAGDRLDADGVPLPGDWRYLTEVLGREATADEEQAFLTGWRHGARID